MKKILPVLLLLLTVVSGAKAAGRTIPEIPSLSGWEENMKTFGLKYIAPIPLGAVNEASVWYYDGIKVYYQIAEYTKDDKYLKGMEYCRDWYRDKFALVLPKAQGWRLFPHGLFIDYKKTGDEKSKQAILKLATTAAFSDQRKNPGRMAPVSLSREVAYNINCYLTAHELRDQRFSVPDTFIEVALGHLDTWNSWLKTDRKSYPYGT
ncbi:MAG: hypothetical protein WCI43_07110, partial [Candidatus Firestonebacteria bacterium]